MILRSSFYPLGRISNDEVSRMSKSPVDTLDLGLLWSKVRCAYILSLCYGLFPYDGEPLPMQDTRITSEQAIAQAQDIGTPHLAPQQPQVKRVNRTRAHPSDLIIRNPSQGVKTRSQYHASFCKHIAFVPYVEPKNVDDALQEENWGMAM